MKETRFKQTEIGLIPEDWKVVTISKIAETSSGGTPSRSIKRYYNGTIRWITTSELKDSKIYDSIEHITEEAVQNSSAKMFPKGTILMAMYGATIGKLGILEVCSTTNQACCAIICHEIKNIYLFYYLFYIRKDIILQGCGAGQPNISQNIVKNINIGLPEEIEQKKIASALTSIDNLLLSLDKLIEKKRLIKQGAMQELLTGKKRLPGFTGEWVERRLGELTKICTGKKNGDESRVFGKYPFFVRSQKVYRIDTFSFDGEAILVPGEGGIGDIFHYINGKFDFHQRVYKISNFNPSIIAMYVYYFMKFYFKEYALAQSVKATVESLRLPTFENFIIRYPNNVQEQKAIATVLSSMDKEIESLEGKKAKYEQIKQGMMQQLLTGKIRLIS